MCAGIHHPTRGGTRGGKDQFDWEDVKTDKDRECYLGHSLMAPVGRWQKGRDLTWYTKKSKTKEYNEMLQAERAAVKKAEEEAMAAALTYHLDLRPVSLANYHCFFNHWMTILIRQHGVRASVSSVSAYCSGFRPASKSQEQQPLSKQEAAEVFRRQSLDDQDEGGEERMKGVGFTGRIQSRKRIDSASNDLKAMFEHDTSSDVKGSVLTLRPEPSHHQHQQTAARDTSSLTDRDKLRAKLKAYLNKKASHKSKRKKEKKSSKSSKRKYQESSDSSFDLEDEWVEASKVKERKKGTHQSKRHKRHSSEDSEAEERQSNRRHRRKKRSDSPTSPKSYSRQKHLRDDDNQNSSRKRSRYDH